MQYFPAGQATQVSASAAAEYVPAAHFKLSEAPAGQYSPAAH